MSLQIEGYVKDRAANPLSGYFHFHCASSIRRL